jgi:hypothetical protein
VEPKRVVKKLLPLGPMAARLGIQSKDLRTEAENGAIPCVHVGDRALLFDPLEVERVLVERAASVQHQTERS